MNRAPDVLLIVSCLGRGTGIDAIQQIPGDTDVDRAPDVLLIVSCLGRGTGIDAIQRIPGDTPFQGQDAPMVGPILLSCVGR
ncbi:hypothetical protein [Planctomonas deserti]|uniref:hypothetical protein n=1 Tax=Planctomonas deserti TaxID=2144185 RepID=UPI000D3CCA79|nr:hypothetical protein [Planctomonas deserti]